MTWGLLLLPEDDLAAVGAWGHTPWGGLQTLEGDVEVARGQRNAATALQMWERKLEAPSATRLRDFPLQAAAGGGRRRGG